jgi:acyl-CoA synthetase (AMP-forming)/AMP-acid ligase II
MVWRSTSEPIDTGGATLHESILATAEAMGDRVTLVDGPSGATVTYEALAARIERAAAGLAARGLRPGDVLALWAPNSPEWAIAALGAMAAGATVSGASPVATARELAAQAMDCEATIIATVPERLPVAARSRRRAACARSWRSGPSRPTDRRRRLRSTPRAPWRCCRTRAARPAFPRA